MRSIFSLRSWILALVLAAVPMSSFAGIFISVNVAPPPLPYYEQPFCPGDGYIWTPGYWADSEDGFFWVPGTWVVAPFVGGLWTPGFWGWGNGLYMWNEGYWGREVGFYGGVNYGYGYGGRGYEGGYWDHDRFNYNRSVNNVNITNIHNVYNKTVINNYNDNRVSYNGGNGGVAARPSPQEQNVLRGVHAQPLPVQKQQVQLARSNRQQWASVNHGVPAIAATPRPGAFNDRGVVPAVNRPVNGNLVTPGRSAPSHDGTPNTITPRAGVPTNMPQRNGNNSSNNGTAPLITAHSNREPAPVNQARPGQSINNPHDGTPNSIAPRAGVPTNMPQRNANPSGNGTAPLITARPNHEPAPTSQARPGQPSNTNQGGRPEYNAPQANNGSQPRYNAPQQRQQSMPQEPRYNAPQQRQQSMQQQPRYNAPPQQRQQEQRYNAPPQRQQSAPQVRNGDPRTSGGRGR